MKLKDVEHQEMFTIPGVSNKFFLAFHPYDEYTNKGDLLYREFSTNKIAKSNHYTVIDADPFYGTTFVKLKRYFKKYEGWNYDPLELEVKYGIGDNTHVMLTKHGRYPHIKNSIIKSLLK